MILCARVCTCVLRGLGGLEGGADNLGNLLSLKAVATEAKQYFAFLGKARLCINKLCKAYSSLGSPGASGCLGGDPKLPGKLCQTPPHLRGLWSPGCFPVPGAAPALGHPSGCCSPWQVAKPGQHPHSPALSQLL